MLFCFLSNNPLQKVNDEKTTKSFLYLQNAVSSLILKHYFLSKNRENFKKFTYRVINRNAVGFTKIYSLGIIVTYYEKDGECNDISFFSRRIYY